MIKTDSINTLCNDSCGRVIGYNEFIDMTNNAGEIVDGRFACVGYAHIDLAQYDDKLVLFVCDASDVFDFTQTHNVNNKEDGFISAVVFDLETQNAEADNLYIDLIREQLNTFA